MDVEQIPEYSIKDFNKAEKTMYELMSPEEQALFDAENKRFVEMWNDPAERQRDSALIDEGAKQVDKESQMRFEDVKDRGRGIWANEEDDEFAQTEDGDDVFGDDEMTSMAHAELELHREVREFARIAAWDMPLLSSRSCNYLNDDKSLINTNAQNSQNLLNYLNKTKSSVSDTQHTWENSIQPNTRSLSSLAPRTSFPNT